MKEKIQVGAFKLFKGFMNLFPEKLKYFIASNVGLLAYYLIKSRRQVTQKNIKIAFPNLDDSEIIRIAKESYKNIGKTFFELLWIDKVKSELMYKEKVDKLANREKGVIVVSLHIDNWEIGGSTMAKSGLNVHVVTKKQKNREFNEIINDIRVGYGVKTIYKGKTSGRQLIKALKEKAVLALISDQYIDDVEVKFFGRKTKAPAGAAMLARKFEAPVIIAYPVRHKNNSHTVYFGDEIELIKTEDEQGDIEKNTQIIYDQMEKIIEKYPEQYFWQHKRWRD